MPEFTQGYQGARFAGARNIETVADLKGAALRFEQGGHPLASLVRVYNASTGEEFRIDTVYEDDSVLCLDITPTGIRVYNDPHSVRMTDGGDAIFGRTDDGYENPRDYA